MMRTGSLLHKVVCALFAVVLTVAFVPLVCVQRAEANSSYTLMGSSSFTTEIIMRAVPKSYPGPWECQGYARWLGAQLTGVDPCGPSLDGIGNKVKPSEGWTMYTSIDSARGLQAGDFIRVKSATYGHAAIVTSVGSGSNPVVQVTEKWNSDPTIHNGNLMGSTSLRTLGQIKARGVYYILRWRGHVHDYKTVASAVCTGYNVHTITKRCACGHAIKTTEACAFTTTGGNRVCAKCKAAGRPYGANTVVSPAAGYYFITSSANGAFCLDVAKGSAATGANVQLWKCNKSKAQQFLLAKNANGTYSIISRIGADKLVGVAGLSSASKANVLMEANNRSTLDGQWIVEKTPDGCYSLRNKYSNLYLDLAGGGAPRKGQNVQQYKGNGTAAQKFKFKRITLADASVTGVVNRTYTGKGTVQRPAVKIGNRTLNLGVDYTLAYKNNVKPGTATVTIKGKGAFAGSSVSRTYKISRGR